MDGNTARRKPTFSEIKTAATDDDDDFGFRIQVLTALIKVHQDKGQLKFAKELLSQLRSAFLDRGLPWREKDGTVTRRAKA